AIVLFFFQAEDGIRHDLVTGVQSVLFRSGRAGEARRTVGGAGRRAGRQVWLRQKEGGRPRSEPVARERGAGGVAGSVTRGGCDRSEERSGREGVCGRGGAWLLRMARCGLL